MIRLGPRARASLLLFGLAAFSVESFAQSDGGPDQCRASADRAQIGLRDGRLVQAHADALYCASEQCSGAVQYYCRNKFLPEIVEKTPTVIVRATDARGRDVWGVRVVVDGKRVRERLDGRAFPVDPGARRLRFEAVSGDVLELGILAIAGVKDRVLDIKFTSVLSPEGQAEGGHDAGPTSQDAGETLDAAVDRNAVDGGAWLPPPASGRPIPAGTWVLGAVGVTSIVLGAVALITAHVDYAAWEAEGCGKTKDCTQRASVFRTAETRANVLAPIGLAVGAASLGGAALWYLLGSGKKPGEGLGFHVGPGAYPTVTYGLRF